MKKITQKVLDQILTDHRVWLDTGGRGGKRANLRGADLRRANLCWADLREADLAAANLRVADLRGANLHRTDLQRADLFGAYLFKADLREADLREANLFGVDLREADLRGASIPLSIRDCSSFHRAAISPEALPWLILHPKWSKWKDSVRIATE